MRFWYSVTNTIEIKDHESIKKNITFYNYFNSTIVEHDNKISININGFDKIDINTLSDLDIRRNRLDPTLQLHLFAMEYLVDYFFSCDENNKLNTCINNIIYIYNSLAKRFLSIYFNNPAPFIDHAISSRIMLVLLLYSYLSEINNENPELMSLLEKDLSIMYGYITNRSKFSYDNNHGLMTLSSIALLTVNINDNHKINQLCEYADDIVNIGFLDYLVAEDGSIYESSSGYWFLIHKKIESIKNSLACKPELNVILADKFNKTHDFINSVSLQNGYLQGSGNSYSQYINENFNREYRVTNNVYVYSYNNKVSGITYATDYINIGIQLPSMDNRPHKHKYPEATAVFVYIDRPLFTNFGTYTYTNTNSIKRRIVSDRSMHGVINSNNNCQNYSSYVEVVQYLELPIVIKSTYKCEDREYSRLMSFDNNFITIEDQSNHLYKHLVESRHLLNPNIIDYLDIRQDSLIQNLDYNKNNISIHTPNNSLDISDSKISLNLNNISDTISILYTDKIIIDLSSLNLSIDSINNININRTYISQREYLYSVMSRYFPSKNVYNFRSLKIQIYITFIINILVMCFLYFYIKYNNKKYMVTRLG